MKRAALEKKSSVNEDDHDHEVEIIEMLPSQGKKRKSSTLFGYGFGGNSSSTSSATAADCPPSLPPLSPPPAWGKLIDEEAAAKVILQRFLGYHPPATRRLFTASYRGTFNDRHNAVPGVGRASSFGRYGSGVRSSLNCTGCLGLTWNSGDIGNESPEAASQWEQDQDDDDEGGGDEEIADIADAVGSAPKALRNFCVVLDWALKHSEILKNCPQDVARLEALRQDLTPSAADLFWRCFHRARAVCRVSLQQEHQQWQGKRGDRSATAMHSSSKGSNDKHDTCALLQELVGKQAILDVTQNETILLTHLYDVFAALRADELIRLNNFLFGSAGASSAASATAANAVASSFSSLGGKRGSATRDDSLATIDNFISQCQRERDPILLRRKLGKDLIKWLGKDVGKQQKKQQQQQQAFRLVCVEPALAKLLQRVFALFFMTNGYDAEDAVVLLWNDLGGLRVVGRKGVGDGGGGGGRGGEGWGMVPTIAASSSSSSQVLIELSDEEEEEKSGTGNHHHHHQPQQQRHISTATRSPSSFQPLGPSFIPPSYAQLFDSSLSLADAFEQAVVAGDAVTAYSCLHAVSNLFLPPPPFQEEQAHEQKRDRTPLLSSLSTLEEGRASSSSGGGCSGDGRGVEVHRLVPPPTYRGLHDLPRVLFKLLSAVMGRGISLLERERKYGQAVHYLRIVLEGTSNLRWSLRGYFHVRLVLDLGHSNRPGDALEACESALADACVDGEDRLFLQGKCQALAVPPRRWKKPVFPVLMPAPVVRLEMAMVQRRRERDGEGKISSLEDGVLACLLEEEEEEGEGRWGSHEEEEDGVTVKAKVDERVGGRAGRRGGRKEGNCQWQGAHCENNIILTLFGLLCWDVLWLATAETERQQQQQSSPATFTRSSSNSSESSTSSSKSSSSPSEYQHAPSDLMLCQEFLLSPARRRALNEVLARVKRGEAPAMLAETHGQHAGTLCLGVDWVSFPLETLQTIAQGFGPPALMLLCETLAKDYSLLAHGFPDLMLWKEGGKEVRLVEVKGPGDSLSWAQKYWIDKLVGVGVRVEVARVVNGEEEKDGKWDARGGKRGRRVGGGRKGRGGGGRGGGWRTGAEVRKGRE